MGLMKSNGSMSSIGFFQARLSSLLKIGQKWKEKNFSFHNLFFKTCFHVLVGHISQGWAAPSAALWISVLHGFSDGISIGSFWFSWGKGTKTLFHNSQKSSSAFRCQATSRFYSRSSCWCYQATSFPSSCALENHSLFINSHDGLWFAPQILAFSPLEFVRKQKPEDCHRSVVLADLCDIVGICRNWEWFCTLTSRSEKSKILNSSSFSLSYGNSCCVIVCSVLQQSFAMLYV